MHKKISQSKSTLSLIKTKLKYRKQHLIYCILIGFKNFVLAQGKYFKLENKILHI